MQRECQSNYYYCYEMPLNPPFLEIFSQAKDKFDQVDIVVGNAGIVDEFNWELCININLVSKSVNWSN